MAEEKTSKNPEVEESSKSSQKKTGKNKGEKTSKKNQGGAKSSKSKTLGKLKHYQKLAERRKKRIKELENYTQENKGDDTSERLKDLELKQTNPDLDNNDVKMAKVIASANKLSVNDALESKEFKLYQMGKKEEFRQQQSTPSPSGRSQKIGSDKTFKQVIKKGGRDEDLAEYLLKRKENK